MNSSAYTPAPSRVLPATPWSAAEVRGCIILVGVAGLTLLAFAFGRSCDAIMSLFPDHR